VRWLKKYSTAEREKERKREKDILTLHVISHGEKCAYGINHSSFSPSGVGTT
jgi:hypothetical protein